MHTKNIIYATPEIIDLIGDSIPRFEKIVTESEDCLAGWLKEISEALEQADQAKITGFLDRIRTDLDAMDRSLAEKENHHKLMQEHIIREKNKLETPVTMTVLDILEAINMDKLLRKYLSDPEQDFLAYLKKRVTAITFETLEKVEGKLSAEERKTQETRKMTFIMGSCASVVSHLQSRAIKVYRRHVENLMQEAMSLFSDNPAANFYSVPSAVVVRFMWRNNLKDKILTFCQQRSGAAYSIKKEILNALSQDNDPEQLILKYLLSKSWKLKPSDVFKQLTADYPEYAALDLVRSYLADKLDPVTLSAEEVQKLYMALQAPHMALLLGQTPDILQEKADELRPRAEMAQKLAETGQAGYGDAIYAAVLADSADDPADTEIENVEAAVFEAAVLPDMQPREQHVINIAQMDMRNSLQKFVREIKERYTDENTLRIDFVCWLGVIKTDLALSTMEMNIINSAEMNFSSQEALDAMTGLLRSLYFKGRIKDLHKIPEPKYRRELFRLFKERGEPERIRRVMWGFFCQGWIENVEIPENILKQCRADKVNPFMAPYVRLTERRGEVFVIEPLYINEAEARRRVREQKDNIFVLGYRAFHARRLPRNAKSRRDDVHLFLASILISEDKPADPQAIEDLELQILCGMKKSKYLEIGPDGYLRPARTQAIRIKSKTDDDLKAEYAEDSNYIFVRGSLVFYSISAERDTDADAAVFP